MAESSKSSQLTYEQLKQKFGELYAQYEKATQYIQQLQSALNSSNLEQISFYLSSLFRVVEHPEMYSDSFVKLATTDIEKLLTSFSNNLAKDEGSARYRQRGVKRTKTSPGWTEAQKSRPQSCSLLNNRTRETSLVR